MDFMESAILTIDKTLVGLSYFGVVIAMLFIGKVIYDKTTPYDFDDELTNKDNKAFAVALAGYLAGLAIALSGSLMASGQDLYYDWLSLAVTGLIATIFMRLTVVINDKLILYKFDNNKEIIQDRNVGTGFVQAGSCLAAGFMLCGVLAGDSGSLVDRIVDVGIYWAIGQAILVASGLVFQWITPYDVHKVLEDDDNMALGVTFGGFLVAVGLIANAALRGATSNIIAELPTVAIWSFFGLLLLSLMMVIVDKVFMPKSKLSDEIVRDKNSGAGAIAAIGFLSVAILFGSSVNPSAPTQSNIFKAENKEKPKVLLLDSSDGQESGAILAPNRAPGDTVPVAPKF